EAVEFIKSKTNINPEYGIILGSGLGELGDEIEEKVVISYKDIPNFVVSTAPSHAGNLVFGKLSGKNIVVMQGRVHAYEGYDPKEITLPIRVMQKMGVKTLVATCAAGGLDRNFKAGELMIITDHLNFTGLTPLTGPNDDELGVRFPVTFDAYTPKLREIAKKVALENKIYVHEGVYFGITGPAFYTRAELRFAIQAGANAIGMSMVQEVIAAAHGGIKVLGIANITDMALPDVEHHSTEKEILEMARKTGPVFRQLIKSILAEME
ncbi:MAG: purine-nucleoside phosphorylase, partial [Candidatus Sericytochromatia bacterium]|nr:purine-nucleoside phosphorylase [Candidatus Sericytochromatia bacterium]